MANTEPKDSRGYFMLPQAPPEAGYYVYGNVGNKPNTGHLAQYAHPDLLSLIFEIERDWQAIDDRKFGIGNISIAGGASYDNHKSHMLGIEMDIRPVRTDKMVGQAAHLTIFDKVYDRKATTKLISLFADHPMVKVIYFNDHVVQQAIGGNRVRSAPTHDNHFHVDLEGRCR